MLKYLGSVGAFIHLNDEVDQTYHLLNIFSSSSLSTLLFSASVNNANGNITKSISDADIYINGLSSSVVPQSQWAHIAFSFNNKLYTSDDNNFIVRFGDSNFSNLNIQNVYLMDSSLSASTVGYLHKEFTGAGSQVLRVNDSASYAINFIDAPEQPYTSSAINYIYQPLKNQIRFDRNVHCVSENSLLDFVSTTQMSADDLYIDGYKLNDGEYVLSLEDNLIYQLDSTSYLVQVSGVEEGDIIRILYGLTYSNYHYLLYLSEYIITPVKQKINYYLNTFDTNNA